MKTAARGQASFFLKVSERLGRAKARAHACGLEVELLGTVRVWRWVKGRPVTPLPNGNCSCSQRRPWCRGLCQLHPWFPGGCARLCSRPGQREPHTYQLADQLSVSLRPAPCWVSEAVRLALIFPAVETVLFQAVEFSFLCPGVSVGAIHLLSSLWRGRQTYFPGAVAVALGLFCLEML